VTGQQQYSADKSGKASSARRRPPKPGCGERASSRTWPASSAESLAWPNGSRYHARPRPHFREPGRDLNSRMKVAPQLSCRLARSLHGPATVSQTRVSSSRPCCFLFLVSKCQTSVKDAGVWLFPCRPGNASGARPAAERRPSVCRLLETADHLS
jgi:hypothetical protein